RRHTSSKRDWSSDVCSSDLAAVADAPEQAEARAQALPDMDGWVTRLGEELADETTGLDRDLVIAIVRESYAGLARSAKLTQHLKIGRASWREEGAGPRGAEC